MKNTRPLVLLVSLVLLVCCNLFSNTPSKVRSGQLYEPGAPEYDAYFKELHLLQVAAAGWDDDKKTSRRPLVDALKFEGDPADVSITQATHERMVAIAHVVGTTRLDVKNDEPHVVAANESRLDAQAKDLFHAVEQVVKSELDRAKALRQVPTKVDVLTKTGRELQPRVQTDFQRRGGDVANEVKQEIDASLEVLGTISTGSRSTAREAEDFVADLQRAIQADPTEPLAVDGGVLTNKPTKPRPTAHPQSNPTTPPVTPPPVKPPPTKPAGGGGEEDFQP
jgi:hypothetical protein